MRHATTPGNRCVTNACRLGVSLGRRVALLHRTAAMGVTNACRLGVSLGPAAGDANGLSGRSGSPMPVGWVCLWDPGYMIDDMYAYHLCHQCLSAGCVFGTGRWRCQWTERKKPVTNACRLGVSLGPPTSRVTSPTSGSPMPVGWVCLWDSPSMAVTSPRRREVTNACRLGVSLGPTGKGR